MGTSIYDRTFVEKLKYWTKDADVHVYGPDEVKRLFEVIADETDDSPIKLPLICLRRASNFTISNPNKKPLTFDGKTIAANEERSVWLNAIPIELQYQLDVYTRYYDEADELVRNLIFNIVNYPRMNVLIPYEDIKIEHDATIRVSPEINDTSSIPERLVAGQFTRFTLNIGIDDAYLWSVKSAPNKKVVLNNILADDEIVYTNIEN